jgi:hypothetical protein
MGMDPTFWARHERYRVHLVCSEMMRVCQQPESAPLLPHELQGAALVALGRLSMRRVWQPLRLQLCTWSTKSLARITCSFFPQRAPPLRLGSNVGMGASGKYQHQHTGANAEQLRTCSRLSSCCRWTSRSASCALSALPCCTSAARRSASILPCGVHQGMVHVCWSCNLYV